MNEVTVVSIDLAKSIFQVCALGAGNEVVFNRKVRRAQLADAIRRHPGVPVVMESCAGSNFWGRTFEAAGHAVRLIPPQHVRAFVRGNKNDANDALAIATGLVMVNVIRPGAGVARVGSPCTDTRVPSSRGRMSCVGSVSDLSKSGLSSRSSR